MTSSDAERKPAEFPITPIRHIERPGLDGPHVQHVDFVGFAVRDMNEGKDVATQVQQGMQSDSRFGRTERPP